MSDEPATESPRVREALEELGIDPSAKPRILACLSGGADSTFLAWALCDIGCEVIAFHLDHGLRKDSSRDAGVAEATANALGIRFVMRRASPDVPEGSSPETAARELRYALAEEVADAESADWIATGHSADDQIETFFINLARGAGLDGLAGIPPKRGRLIRPMLSVERSEARARCEAEGLKFTDDPTNASNAMLRNRIRHDLLPKLDEVLGPGFRPAMFRQFRYMRGDAELLNALADLKLKDARPLAFGAAIAIPVAGLGGMADALARRVVRRGLAEIGLETPPAGRFVEAALDAADGGGSADVGGGFVARREGEWLVLRPGTPLTPESSAGSLPGAISATGFGIVISSQADDVPEPWPADPNIVWIDDSLAGDFLVRAPRPGDRFAPLSMGGSKPLADFLASAGFTRTERETVPLLVRGGNESGGGEVVWVIGHRLGEVGAVPGGALRALRIEATPL